MQCDRRAVLVDGAGRQIDEHAAGGLEDPNRSLGLARPRAEVQAVGVPAGLDRHVGMRPLVRVPGAGPMEQAELVVGQVEQATPERPGKLGGTRAVVGVRVLIDPPGVVQDGE